MEAHDKCAAADGSSMRLDGPRTDRAAHGGIQAAGSFRRMRIRTARGAITELASRRSKVEKAAWASDQSMVTWTVLPLQWACILVICTRGSCVISRAESLYIREGGGTHGCHLSFPWLICFASSLFLGLAICFKFRGRELWRDPLLISPSQVGG